MVSVKNCFGNCWSGFTSMLPAVHPICEDVWDCIRDHLYTVRSFFYSIYALFVRLVYGSDITKRLGIHQQLIVENVKKLQIAHIEPPPSASVINVRDTFLEDLECESPIFNPTQPECRTILWNIQAKLKNPDYYKLFIGHLSNVSEALVMKNTKELIIQLAERKPIPIKDTPVFFGSCDDIQVQIWRESRENLGKVYLLDCRKKAEETLLSSPREFSYQLQNRYKRVSYDNRHGLRRAINSLPKDHTLYVIRDPIRYPFDVTDALLLYLHCIKKMEWEAACLNLSKISSYDGCEFNCEPSQKRLRKFFT